MCAAIFTRYAAHIDALYQQLQQPTP
jgi:hypothetical protein